MKPSEFSKHFGLIATPERQVLAAAIHGSLIEIMQRATYKEPVRWRLLLPMDLRAMLNARLYGDPWKAD